MGCNSFLVFKDACQYIILILFRKPFSSTSHVIINSCIHIVCSSYTFMPSSSPTLSISSYSIRPFWIKTSLHGERLISWSRLGVFKTWPALTRDWVLGIRIGAFSGQVQVISQVIPTWFGVLHSFTIRYKQ